MPFFQIERTVVPVTPDGAAEKAPEEIGSDSRAYAGNLRSTIRATKRNWGMNTKFLDITTCERIRQLVSNGAFCMVTGDAIGDQVNDTNGMVGAPVGVAVVTAAGGALAAATYYYKVTGMNNQGETVGSAEVNVVTALNNKNTVSWTALAGATWYRLYYGTAAGVQIAFFDNIIGTSFIHDGLIVQRSFSWISFAPPAAAIVGVYARITLSDGAYRKIRGAHRRQLVLNVRAA